MQNEDKSLNIPVAKDPKNFYSTENKHLWNVRFSPSIKYMYLLNNKVWINCNMPVGGIEIGRVTVMMRMKWDMAEVSKLTTISYQSVTN
jgi:hypothetical protein